MYGKDGKSTYTVETQKPMEPRNEKLFRINYNVSIIVCLLV